MPEYPAAVTELLAVAHPTALGPGTPAESLRAKIKATHEQPIQKSGVIIEDTRPTFGLVLRSKK